MNKAIILTLITLIACDRSPKVTFERATAEINGGKTYSQYVDNAGAITHKTYGCGKDQIRSQPIDIGKADSLCVPNTNVKKDGEDATSASECKSNIVVDKKCARLEETKPCTADINCQSGLFCSTTCQKRTDKCPSNRNEECSGSKVCNAGACVDSFSLELGTAATSHVLCASGFQYEGKCAEVKYDDKAAECPNGSCSFKVKTAKEGDGESKTVACVYTFGKEDKQYCPVPETTSKVVTNYRDGEKARFGDKDYFVSTPSLKYQIVLDNYPLFEGLDDDVINDLINARMVSVGLFLLASIFAL